MKRFIEGVDRSQATLFIDAASGGHIWAERYDGDMENIFEFQDDIRDQIVAALQVSLTPTEKAKTQRHLTNSVEAYELFLRARTFFFQFNPQAFDESVRLYQQAIEVDPDFAAVYANLSMVLQTGWSFLFPGYDEALDRALNCAEKAVEIDSELGLAHARLGWVQTFMCQYDEAIENFERAIELSSDDADTYAYFAQLLNWVGDPERAIEMIKESVRFDPLLPPNCAMHWGESLFQLKRYDEAINKLGECIDKAPGFLYAHIILASLYGETGQEEEAAGELELISQLLPAQMLHIMLQQVPWRGEELRARIYNGLRQAGSSDI